MFIPIIVLGVLVIGFYCVINRDLKADHALAKARKEKRKHDCGHNRR